MTGYFKNVLKLNIISRVVILIAVLIAIVGLGLFG